MRNLLVAVMAAAAAITFLPTMVSTLAIPVAPGGACVEL
jgi:hypothetical protein